MKFVDRGEFFVSKEDNNFDEYKKFSPEQFFVNELKDSPKEIIDIKESNSDSSIETNRNKKQSNNIDELTKNINKNIKTISHSVSESVAVATGATSSVVVVAAAVVISVATGGSLFTNIAKYISREVGNNYSLIEIDMDSVLKEDEKLYDLSVNDFTLKVFNNKKTDENYECEVKAGKQKYLIPNLNINTTYTYELVCNKNILGDASNFYKEEFKTSIDQNPKGILDSQNTYISYLNELNSYSFNYSVYVSDYYKTLENTALYICDKQQDYKNISDVIFIDSTINDNNFIERTIENVTYPSLYLYLVEENEEGTKLLMEEVIETGIDIPPIEDITPITINEESVEYNNLPNKVDIAGTIKRIDNELNYVGYISTFDDDGNIISSDIEAEFNIEIEENITKFNLNSFIDYGTKEFIYKICYFDENDYLQIAYESSKVSFNENQNTYLASFDVKNIEDSFIDYFDDHVEITIDSNFVSTVDNYFYELNVVNSNNVILDSYLGQDVAKFTIPNSADLNSLKFIYKEVCEFNDGYHYLSSFESNEVEFSNPNVYLDSDVLFDGMYFSINYQAEMVFAYEDAFLDIIVESIDNTYTYTIDNLKEKDSLILNQIDLELGVVQIKGILHFKDFTSSNSIKNKSFDFGQFDLSYKFEIAKVETNISPIFGEIPAEVHSNFYFSYRLPSSYTIKIEDANHGISVSEPVTEKIFVGGISYEEGATLSLSVVDKEGNIYIDNVEFNINPTLANNNYTNPSYYSANPYDSVVTYNDDGTANIYRNTNFVKSDYSSINLNCLIYTDKSKDELTGEVSYFGRIDSYVENNYSIIENIERSIYMFEYQVEFEYDNVTYIMYTETPSGSINLLYEGYFTAESSVTSEKTIITIYNNQSIYTDNYILINGVEYQFDSYDSYYQSSYSLTFNEEIHVNEAMIRVNDYGSNYLDYSSEIEMKGNRYFYVNVSVSEIG